MLLIKFYFLFKGLIELVNKQITHKESQRFQTFRRVIRVNDKIKIFKMFFFAQTQKNNILDRRCIFYSMKKISIFNGMPRTVYNVRGNL